MLEMVPVRGVLGVALFGFGCSLLAARTPPTSAPPPTIEVAAIDEPESTTSEHTSDVLADASVQLVFTLHGESYVALQDLDANALPRHGKLRMIPAGDDYIDAAIASVSAKYAAPWNGRTFIVDDGSEPGCTSVLAEFAIVARLTGDPGYAGIDGDDGWTARSILEHGHPVLAAKLGCRGTFARDASAQHAVMFGDVLDPASAMVARRLVLESQAAADITAEWKAANQSANWYDATEVVEKVVRDPRSNTTWISVFGNSGFSCGEPGANIWGLFRVERNGNLTTIALRRPENLSSVDELVDLDGDGIPEIVGTSWLGPNTIVTDIDGNERARLDVPFYGCPC